MLSIVICTLNEERYLPKLLESFLHQAQMKGSLESSFIYELLVIDAGSNDNTQFVADSFAGRLPLKFVVSERGIAKQRNKGAELAQFEHLLFLDADVVLPFDFLKNAMNEIQQKKLLIAGNRIYAAEKVWNYRASYWLYSHAYLPLVRLSNPVIHGCAIFSTKNLHQKIGGFAEGLMFEDYAYGVAAARHFRPPLLTSTYVYTSARRFYNASFMSVVELLMGGLYTFFKAGFKLERFKWYHQTTGKHEEPKY